MSNVVIKLVAPIVTYRNDDGERVPVIRMVGDKEKPVRWSYRQNLLGIMQGPRPGKGSLTLDEVMLALPIIRKLEEADEMGDLVLTKDEHSEMWARVEKTEWQSSSIFIPDFIAAVRDAKPLPAVQLASVETQSAASVA